MDITKRIRSIIQDVIEEKICGNEATINILMLHEKKLSLFQKNKLDLLNWAKSELKQEENHKLGKTMTPYRSDKIIFLRRVIGWITNKD